jgi:hypothetical protein
MPDMTDYGEGPMRRVYGPAGKSLGSYPTIGLDDPDPTNPIVLVWTGHHEVPVVPMGGGNYRLKNPEDLRKIPRKPAES